MPRISLLSKWVCYKTIFMSDMICLYGPHSFVNNELFPWPIASGLMNRTMI